MKDMILYRLTIDTLDDSCAIYSGPNESSVVIDRAAFNGQGMPTWVEIHIPRIERDRRSGDDD